MYPENLQTRKPLDLKLGIKSSMPDPVKLLLLNYLIWISSNKKTEIIYSEIIEIGVSEKIKISDKLLSYIKEFLVKEKVAITSEFENTINKNPLLVQHFESLFVALELVWKVAKIQFLDNTLPISAERTGGKRYPKKLNFTKNMEIFHHIIKDTPHLFESIISIITDSNKEGLDVNNLVESKIAYALTFIMDEAKFQLKDENGNYVKFTLEEVYLKLVEDQIVAVNLKSSEEAKGSLRILYSLLSNNLNYYLKIDSKTKEVEVRENKKDELTEYYYKLKNFNDIYTSFSSIEVNADIEKKLTSTYIPFLHNRILYGAPGTGKSHLLNEQVRENFSSQIFGEEKKQITAFERVTFYDGYTYGQFIGMYKPILKGTDITYEYTPGSFMRLLVNALKFKEHNFCLIIEELNRAKADKVFGNIFQLLDREDNSKSTYHIAVSEDQKKYLSEELKENEELLNKILHTGLFIPENFYIWATMNSADQGVYPLDSAFKRRWSFEHIGLNENEDKFGDKGQKYYVQYSIGKEEIEWNDFRRQINNELLKNNIPEDKLLAPFFIKSRDFIKKDDKNILDEKVFLNKILVYLFDDVLRHKKKTILFSEECSSFSNLKDNFVNEKSIFSLNFEKITTILENDTEEENV